MAKAARKYTSNGELLKNQEEILRRQEDLARNQEQIVANQIGRENSLEAGEVLKALKQIKEALEVLAKKVDNLSAPPEPKSRGWLGWR